MLSKRMNGQQSTCMIMNSDLPVPINTKFHQLPYQESWSICIIQKQPDATPNYVHCQYETALHLAL